MWQYNHYPQTELYHHGILGQKWGIRRFQNKDGSLTAAGRKHYDVASNSSEKPKRNVNWKKVATGAAVAAGIAGLAIVGVKNKDAIAALIKGAGTRPLGEIKKNVALSDFAKAQTANKLGDFAAKANHMTTLANGKAAASNLKAIGGQLNPAANAVKGLGKSFLTNPAARAAGAKTAAANIGAALAATANRNKNLYTMNVRGYNAKQNLKSIVGQLRPAAGTAKGLAVTGAGKAASAASKASSAANTAKSVMSNMPKTANSWLNPSANDHSYAKGLVRTSGTSKLQDYITEQTYYGKKKR